MEDDSTRVLRRNVRKDSDDQLPSSASVDDFQTQEDDDDKDSKEVRLTLMEEVLLLGLKDREGYLSFWNDSISGGLRGCVMIELGLRSRIVLGSAGMRRRGLLSRSVVMKKNIPTGDVLLDEALKHIRDNPSEDVKTWIGYLSGETWNPFKLPLQLRNVRERLAKNLAEKGVCTTEKQNFVLFDMTTHPLVDSRIKQRVVTRIQEGLLQRWTTDLQKMDRRLLSLIVLAHHSDVLENALASLCDSDYDLAMKRVRSVLNADYTAESEKDGACDVMWAVFASFCS